MRRFTEATAIPAAILLVASLAMAQSQTQRRVNSSQLVAPASMGVPSVTGGGTQGKLTKWIGFTSSSSVIGDANIFEDKFGNVGIGTTTPTSPLTVQGMIETTLGGIKFPDGTVQTTAGLSASQVVKSLNGLIGDLTLQAGANITVTPSGNTLVIAAPNSLSAVTHNATITGIGTSASPLGVAVPLLLRGSSSPQPILTVENDGSGFAIQGTGLDQNGLAGFSNTADGTSGQTNGANHSGVLGVNTNGAGWGVKGFNSSNSNNGYLGGPSSGVYGFSSSGNGVTGESSTGMAGNFIGNVSINGTLGIGTTPSSSKLAVGGLIQSTNGGFQFPDGTIQTTAATNASGNFIQNTATQQPNSNFNISGNGTAGGELHATTVTADAFFNIASHRMLSLAGDANPDTSTNTAVGIGAGTFNGFFQTTPLGNTFVGRDAGHGNVAANENTFIGYQAGMHNDATGNIQAPEANANTFVGYQAGFNNTGTCVGLGCGARNTFVGHSAGKSNTDGDHNTTIGYQADVGGGDLKFATAIGAGALVSSSNTIALGRSDGSDTVDVPGKLQIDTLATGGSTTLCLNSANRVGSCSSSLRYKTTVQPFLSGLGLIDRLHPITFTWKADGKPDVGLAAEDVAAAEPLLVTRNLDGQVEGVKYDRVAVVLVNAIKEQQQQLAAQQVRIEALQAMTVENARLRAQLVELVVRLEQLEKERAGRK
jgi:endosialidase-like protein